jgi:hypothetical protein
LVGVAALAVVGAFVDSDSGSDGADAVPLQSGVCLNGVTFDGEKGTYSFDDLEEVACASPHDGEVYYVFTGAEARRANASEAAFTTVGTKVCVEEFAGYVGTSLAQSGYVTAGIGPAELGDAAVDEAIGCVLMDPDGPLRGTARGSKESSSDPVSEDTSVVDLAEGDCVADLSFHSTTFAVEVVDCSGPHEAEVYGAFDLEGDEYPDDIQRTSEKECVELFTAYVGKTFEDSILNAAPLSPTPSSWKVGDREVLCLLMSLDGTPLTASMKGAGV